MQQTLGLETETSDNGEYGSFSYPEGSLWLEMVGLTTNRQLANVIVHGTQSGHVYELWTKTNLLQSTWSIEAAVHAITNQDFTPTTVPVLYRTNLFVWARDWTGVDENTNSLPDWWEWENFGNFTQPTNGDFDLDGANNWDEYIAGTDPNTIVFSLLTASKNLNTNIACLRLWVLAGVPSSAAVIVDSTNIATATWTAFSSNLTANLGLTEGWHDVHVGLRGRKETSDQTWVQARIKLDWTPPIIVITNPTSLNLSRPTIQLQGYCAEAVSAFTFDLTNASGSLSNGTILVTSQDYATNTSEFTTNYFQGYDIPLQPGTNLLILRATDLAGNTNTTNILLNLDYSSNTNPPAITLDWPRDGTRVSGETFTWRGALNDPTASLVIQTVDTNGVTNLVAGAVGRDGTFRLKGVPLAGGTNAYLITATDAGGHLSSTRQYHQRRC